MTELFQEPLPLEEEVEQFDDVVEQEQTALKEGDINYRSVYGAVLSQELGDDRVEKQREIATELSTTGFSPTLQNITGFIEKDADIQRRASVEQLLQNPDLTMEQKQAVVKGYVAIREEDFVLHKEALQQVSVEDYALTEEEAKSQDRRSAQIASIVSYQDDVASIANASIANLDSSTPKALLEFAEIVLPFVDGVNVLQIADELKEELGIEIGPLDLLLYGNMKQEIKNTILNLSPERRLDVVKKLSIAIDNNSGILLDNDFQKFSLIQDLIATDGYSDNQATVDNVIGVIDALIPAGEVLRTAKTYYKANRVVRDVPPTAPLARITQANPDAGGGLAAAAIVDKTETTARLLGTEQVDIVTDFVFPKPEVKLGNAPADIVERVAEIRMLGEALARQVETAGILFSDEEKLANRVSAINTLNKAKGLTLHKAKSAIKGVGTRFTFKGSEGYRIEAIYGANKTSGFLNVKDAEVAARAAFGDVDDASESFFDNISILKKDEVTGEVEKEVTTLAGLKTELGTTGEYFIKYNYKNAYDPEIADVLGKDAISMSSFGRSAKYLFPSTSRFSRSIRHGAARAVDQGAAIEKQLFKAATKDLLALPKKGQAKVMQALEMGKRNEKNYKDGFLRTHFKMDVAERKAYFAARATADISWSINNRDLYLELDKAGVKSVYVGNVDTQLLATPVKQDRAREIVGTTLSVFDPIEESLVVINQTSLKELYEQGGEIAKLSSGEYVGTANKLDYVLIDPMKKTRTGSLTNTPLNYRAGYSGTYYKSPYFVEVVYKSGKVNGREEVLSRTAGIARTQREADGIADRLTTNLTEEDMALGATVNVRKGKELEEGSRELDLQEFRQQSIRSRRHRGEILEGADEHGAVEDVLHSMIRDFYAIGNHVATKKWFKTNQNRFIKTWPDLSIGGYPKSVDELIARGKASTMQQGEINQAIQLFEYGESLRGLPPPMSTKWRNGMLHVADLIDGSIGGTKVGDVAITGIQKVGEVNPLATLKSSAFLSFIATNPLGQFVLQASQLAQMVAITPKYVTTGQMATNLGGLSLMLAARGRKAGPVLDQLEAKGSFMLGTSVEDARLLIDSFESSGLRLSIDNHAFVEGQAAFANRVLTDGITQAGAKGIAETVVGETIGGVSKAITASRIVGFDAGEYVNLAGTWLVALERFKKAHPEIVGSELYSRGVLDTVAAEARDLSYTMSRAGKMGYQGHPNSMFAELMSVPMQFLAVPHKAIMTALPKKLGGSRVYSTNEKYGLLATNIALFGGAAYPFLNDTVDIVAEEGDIDLSAPWYVALRGGLVDYALFAALNGFNVDTGEAPTMISASGRFAPASLKWGNVGQIAEQFLNDPIYKLALGASGAAGSKIWDSFTDVGTVMSLPDMSTPEKIMLSFESIANTSSGFSNYFKYRYMLESGKLISGSGNESVAATRAESIAKLFGIPSYSERDYHELSSKFFGGKKGTVKDKEKQIRNDARAYYTSLKRVYGLYGEDQPSLDRNLAMLKAFNFVYSDPVERDVVVDEFFKMIKYDGENKVDSLVDMILKKNIGGEFSEDLLKSIRNNRAIPDKQRNFLIEQLENAR